MSEPKIAVKCTKCGEVTLVRLSERAILEGYFRCSKCGHLQLSREPRPPEEPIKED